MDELSYTTHWSSCNHDGWASYKRTNCAGGEPSDLPKLSRRRIHQYMLLRAAESYVRAPGIDCLICPLVQPMAQVSMVVPCGPAGDVYSPVGTGAQERRGVLLLPFDFVKAAASSSNWREVEENIPAEIRRTPLLSLAPRTRPSWS